MDVLTQIEGAAGQHPFLAKVFLVVLVVLFFKFKNSNAGFLSTVLGWAKAIFDWLITTKVDIKNSSGVALSAPALVTASTRVSAIQTLIADAMASGDNQALDNIVAVAKGYQKTATTEAKPQ